MRKQTGGGVEGDEDVLTITQVCQMTGLSRPTICKWITCGALAAVKRGRTWSVRRGDLVALFRDFER